MACTRGFTLVECMVAITLSLILLSLTIVSFSGMQAWLVRGDLDTLAQVCRYAQQYALMTQTQQVLAFNDTQRSYTFNNRTYYLSPGVQFGTLSGVQGPPKNPVHVLTNPITFIRNQIIFSQQGVISSGTVYLTNKNSTVMYALSNAVSSTSFLRKYVYRGSWQVLA